MTQKSMKDRVQANEAAVDAAIAKTQGVLEALKQSPHSAWVLLAIGVLLLVAGGVLIWSI